jgi:flagellar biogenesis protein FliO
MYRSLVWLLLVGPLSCFAVADDSWLQVPERFQRHGPVRPIGQAESERSASPATTPTPGQRPETMGQTSGVAPRADDTRLASHDAHTPAAGAAVPPPASGAPFQAPNRLPAAAATREAMPAANAPLPISRTASPKVGVAADQPPTSTTVEPSLSPGIDSLITVAASLGIVLGLFFVLTWCFRRGMPKSARSLPPEVVEVLGRAPLAGKQQMHLIRFGNKLVLAAISPGCVDTISEITDPVEVNRLAGYCEQMRAGSTTASFRGILDRLDERGDHDASETYPRRPKRDLASVVGLKGSRAEDDYV